MAKILLFPLGYVDVERLVLKQGQFSQSIHKETCGVMIDENDTARRLLAEQPKQLPESRLSPTEFIVEADLQR
jgi:hypothetical protein